MRSCRIQLTKKKPTRIVRRFTKEDIVKLYNNPKAKLFGSADPVVEEKQIEPYDLQMRSGLPEGVNDCKLPYLVIDGIPYQSSREAAKVIGGNYNTILRKCKANKDGYFYIEK